MKLSTIIGAVLIVLGVAALAYKGFNYKSEETVLQIGSVKATAKRRSPWPFRPGRASPPSWSACWRSAWACAADTTPRHFPKARAREPCSRETARRRAGPVREHAMPRHKRLAGNATVCQSSSPANRLAGDQSPGDLAQGRNLRRQSKGRGLTAS